MDVLNCTMIMADAQGGVTVPSIYGMLQVLVSGVSLRTGGCSNGTERESGPRLWVWPVCVHNLGLRHTGSWCADFRALRYDAYTSGIRQQCQQFV